MLSLFVRFHETRLDEWGPQSPPRRAGGDLGDGGTMHEGKHGEAS